MYKNTDSRKYVSVMVILMPFFAGLTSMAKREIDVERQADITVRRPLGTRPRAGIRCRSATATIARICPAARAISVGCSDRADVDSVEKDGVPLVEATLVDVAPAAKVTESGLIYRPSDGPSSAGRLTVRHNQHGKNPPKRANLTGLTTPLAKDAVVA